MNWNAVGSIAEILGALGVIASLLYLSRQIRQSTKASRLATSHSLATAIREYNSPMLADPAMARTMQQGWEDPAQLDEAERARFMQMAWRTFSMLQDAHYQFRHGALDEEIWEYFAQFYGLYVKSPGMQIYWKMRRDVYPPDFRDFIDTLEPPDLPRLDAMLKVVERSGSSGGHSGDLAP